jgi:hypothetical protein
MDKNAFGEFLKSLCHYYERREPREQTLDLWFRDVKYLPDEPLDWMRGHICGQQEIFPRNLPSVMRDLWRQWLENNPRRQAHTDTEIHCPDCDGSGMVVVYRQSYRYAFRCGRCRQSRLQGIPLASVSDLLTRGYSLTSMNMAARQAHGGRGDCS